MYAKERNVAMEKCFIMLANVDPVMEQEGRRAWKDFTKCHTVPAFMILGAQKCGTTSLYDYLWYVHDDRFTINQFLFPTTSQHPAVQRCKRREPHFFDWKWKMANEDVQLSSKQRHEANELYAKFENTTATNNEECFENNNSTSLELRYVTFFY